MNTTPSDEKKLKKIWAPSSSSDSVQSPRTRTLNAVIALILVTVCVAVAGFFISKSSVLSTHSTSNQIIGSQDFLVKTPRNWKAIWSHSTSSAALASTSAIITSSNHAVEGRNPHTGQIIWKYQRAEELCQTILQHDIVVANFRDNHGCGDMTALYADTGSRYRTRSGFADPQVHMFAARDRILSFGSSQLHLYRDDLGLIITYGQKITPIEPAKNPSPPCPIISAHLSSHLTAVIQRCSGEEFNRLTVFDISAWASNSYTEKISRVFPLLGTTDNVHIIHVDDAGVLVTKETPQDSEILHFSSHDDGKIIYHTRATHTYPTRSAPTTSGDTILSYWIEGKTLQIDQKTLHINQIIDHTLGNGVELQAQWYFPTPSGEIMYGNKRPPRVYRFPRNQPLDYVDSATDEVRIIEVTQGTLTVREPLL